MALTNPGRIVLLADDGANQKFLGKLLPFIRFVTMKDNHATGYLCKDFTCLLPQTEPDALRAELAGDR